MECRLLKNGMHFATVPTRGTQAAAVLVYVGVGSKHEAPHLHGASHFIEHMLFKGTKRRPTSVDISRELESYGADFNAYTGHESTMYYVKIAAPHLAKGIDLLHDMLTQSMFAPKELAKERQVILEEIKMYEDAPRMHVDDVLTETMYAGTPLGHNIAGTRQTMTKMRRTDVLKYKEEHYIPENMTVVLAGAFSKQDEVLVEKLFGGIKAAGKKGKKLALPIERAPQAEPKIAAVTRTTEQIQISIGFPAYALTDPRNAALQVLATVLGGGMSSRLFVAVREKHALAYGVSAGCGAFQDAGQAVITAGVDKARLERALGTIWSEVKKVVTRPITRQELQDAQEQIAGRLLLGMEECVNQGEWFGKQICLTPHHVLSVEEYLALIRAVTLEDVQRVAQEVFVRKAATMALVGPVPEHVRFPV